MTTPAEQEAERRYPPLWVEPGAHGEEHYAARDKREAFASGAAFEREQLRELLEAAREVVTIHTFGSGYCHVCEYDVERCGASGCWVGKLRAAAAALEEA